MAAIVAAVTRVTGDEVDKALVGAVFVAAVAITILAGFVKRAATTYTITTHRLNIKRESSPRKVRRRVWSGSRTSTSTSPSTSG